VLTSSGLQRLGRLNHVHLGALVYPGLDQADLTGPFAVLSRIPNSTFHLVAKDLAPVRDMHGLVLTPTATFHDPPALNVLVVPGGFGQEAAMDDTTLLESIVKAAAGGARILSVCTGALLCGAAGLLRQRRATTHWSAFHLLRYFGAIPEDTRVVDDGQIVSTAGVTAGIDGALLVAARLRGDAIAQQIQLTMEYAPVPPFNCGTPSTASPDIVAAVRTSYQQIAEARLATARRFAARFEIESL
jgi:cyclohexyl-isocyanide hydratase